MRSVLGEMAYGRLTGSLRLRNGLRAAGAVLLVAVASSPVSAATYQVGPGRQYTQISQVATIVNPGDIVEVDGNATYGPVTFTRAGTASQRIIIRGIRVGGNRPIISGSDQYGYTVYLRSSNGQMGYLTLEGFEVTNGSQACIRNQARDIVFRDIKVHGCARHGLLSHDYNSGNLTISFAEFTNIGGTYAGENVKHPIYITTSQDTLPGSVCRVEYSYIHHNRSGNNIKSRCERNEIYYNWIEGAETYELELIGPEDSGTGRRCDSDVVGNVLYGYGGYIIRMGSDGHSDTNGRYRFLNNTMVVTSAGFGGVTRHLGAVQSIEFINNIIHDLGGATNQPRLHRLDGTWTNGEVCTGSNNWITSGFATSQSSSACGAVLSSAVRGSTPGFVNAGSAASFDPRLVSSAAAMNIGTTTTSGTNSYPVPNQLATADRQPPFRLSAEFTALAPVSRTASGAVDAGAYEQGSSGTTTPPPAAPSNLRIIR